MKTSFIGQNFQTESSLIGVIRDFFERKTIDFWKSIIEAWERYFKDISTSKVIISSSVYFIYRDRVLNLTPLSFVRLIIDHPIYEILKL